MKQCGIFYLLFLLLRLISVATERVSTGSVSCTSQVTCGACMKLKGCSWCKSEQPGFGSAVRCDWKHNLKEKGCPEEDIVDQKNYIKNITDDKLSDAGAVAGHAIQIRPQRIKLSLRPNHPVKLKLTFRQAEDYPVDLYYLMDLTANMRDHKEKLAELGDRLAASMNKITKNFRLGFGSFVDKVVMPYANMVPEKLENPCSEESACIKPYGYQNHLALDKNVTRFVNAVDSAQFSGNLDDAEGGLDAIMQAIVCKDDIKWDKRSRRIILFATGSTFHVAGDGKLGGIVKPNDGSCHMSESGYYTETLNQDYPSLSQINTAIGENKVSVIFAVPNDQIRVYQRMSEVLQGASAAELAQDSSNIVQLVADHYNKISSEVRMVDDFPSGVQVSYSTKCLGKEIKNTSICNGLKVGATVEFDVELNLKTCSNNTADWKKEVTIHPLGLQDNLIIDLELQCECQCEADSDKVNNSKLCNENGKKVCGTCQCNRLSYGRDCECSGAQEEQFKNVNLCKQTNSSKVCSGRGLCRCGVCECFKLESEDHLISGEFCEWDNYSCDSGTNGEICGGSDKGTCGYNSKCNCKNGWSGRLCDCAGPETCIDPNDPHQSDCNGNGKCDCGKCVCYNKDNRSYLGQYCDKLQQTCELYDACVQCQVHKEGVLTEEECSNCSFVPIVQEIVPVKEKNETRCQVEDDDNCVYIYVFSYDEELHQVHVRAQKEKVCQGKVDMMYVAIGVSVGVFILGILVILIVRLCMYLKDRREYQAHLKQVADTDWNKATENPLHVPPSTKYKNPTFGMKF